MTQATIEKRTLGRTGVEVTRLGYGTMELRGERIWGGRPIRDEQADTILNDVLDSGINFLDTSADYGKSEELIGKFAGSRRAEYVLTTKTGCEVVPGEETDQTLHDFSRDHMLSNIENSLRLLRTDHLDFVQLHNPTVEQAETSKVIDTMREIVANGQAGAFGISSRSPDLRTFVEWDVFDVFQIPYSALERAHENLITRAHETGAGVIVRSAAPRSSVGGGLGKEDRWATWQQAGLEELLEPGESRARWMLRYLLSHPHIDTVIIGTINPDHLQENLADLAAGPLAADVYAEAKLRLDRAGRTPEDA
ncbi:aldo/keto reductase [Microbacterium sp. LWS13-1.2]|uniref:Aldo/keto reductase n=1 Tax=Microbacterium sp. LWS13-1.2 TaxID=3135264 RepID=A0AAU6SAT5_9MICO